MSLYEKLLIAIAALLPAYLIRFSLFSIPTTVLEILIWATALFGVLQSSARQSWIVAIRVFPKPVLLAACCLLLSAVVSTAISPHLHTSLGILKGWIITPILYAFMVYAATGEGKKKIEIRKKIIEALILSGVVMALFGLSQVGTLNRIRGVFDVPNSLTLFLAPLVILAAYSPPLLLPLTKGETQEGVFFRIAAAVMLIALLFTQSVAGVLSVFTVLGLFLCFKNWKLKPVWYLCFGLCALGTALVLMPKIGYLIQPGSSAHVRLQLWSISWDLIKEHPLLGIGLGTFEPAYQQKLHERFRGEVGVPAPLAEFVFRDPHNWVLSFWLNLGLLGLASFAFLNGYVLWQALLPLTKGESPPWAGVGVALALVTLLLFGLTDTIYWKNDLAALHWLLLALLLNSYLVNGKRMSAAN